ncbi:unnamed protein product [Diamesa hyperborea]
MLMSVLALSADSLPITATFEEFIKYKELFHKLLSSRTSPDITNHQIEVNYCYSKMLIEEGFSIEVNPFNIDTKDVNCNEVIMDFRQFNYEMVRGNYLKNDNSNEVNCIISQYEKFNSSDVFVKLTNLARVSLTAEQLNVEKLKFITLMILLKDEERKCLYHNEEVAITEQPSSNIQAIPTNDQEQSVPLSSTTEINEILNETDDEATNMFSQTTNNIEADEDEYFEITDSPTQIS